jgi:hypothetical protein
MDKIIDMGRVSEETKGSNFGNELNGLNSL